MNKKMKPFDMTLGRLAKPIRLIGLGFLLSGLSIEAYATNGFIMHGYGKTDQMAGAGTAHPQDAIAASSNPAGMAWVGTRFDAGLMAFIPPRGVDTSDSFFFGGATPPGGIDSERNYFPIPQIGFAYQMDELSTFGYSVYGAGLGTKYLASSTWNVNNGLLRNSGLFFGGKTGIDLMAAINDFTYSRKVPEINWQPDLWGFGLKNVSFGYGAQLGMVTFKADGLQLFNLLSYQAIPSERDWSFGVGYSIGGMADIYQDVTMSVGYHSKIDTRLRKYAGLFSKGGTFTLPGRFNLGFSWKASDALRVNADYEWINYNEAEQTSDDFKSFLRFPTGSQEQIGLLGGISGPGFGWQNSNVYKIGAEYKFQSMPKWIWRGGYSYQDQIVQQSQALFNSLAPAVIQEHYTVGFTNQFTENLELSMQLMYAPKVIVHGQGTGIDGLSNGVNIWLQEFGLEGSVGYTF